MEDFSRWAYCLITWTVYENPRGLYTSEKQAQEALDTKLLQEKLRLENSLVKYKNHIAKIVRYFNEKRR